MPDYKCNICNFYSTLKSNFKGHLETNKHEKNVINYEANLTTNDHNLTTKYVNLTTNDHNLTTNDHNLTTNIQKEYNKNYGNKKFVCDKCDKELSTKGHLKRHIKMYCKVVKKNENELSKNVNNIECLLQNQKKMFDEEKKNLYKQIEILLNKVGNTTINNTQNIQLNNYGNEDLSHISDIVKTKLIAMPYGMIPKLIEAVHFNDKKPENKNILLPNKKDKLIKIYKDNKWHYKTKDETLNDLVDSKYTILDSHYDFITENSSKDLSPFVKSSYNKFRTFYDEGDKKLIEQLKQDCELVLLNNR